MKISADNFKEFTFSDNIICPHCKKAVFMKLFKATNGVGLFNVSLYDVNVDVFSLCPSCKSLFALDKNDSKALVGDAIEGYKKIDPSKLSFIRELE